MMIDSKKTFVLNKRQLETNGETKKRFKKDLQTFFDDLPNEIYRDIFDYFYPSNIIQSFYGLNQRLNRLIDNLLVKINLTNFNKKQYKDFLKLILSKRTEQIVSIDFGRLDFNTEYRFDLFIQSFHFNQLSNLQTLSLTSSNMQQFEFLFSNLSSFSSLRSLYLFEQYSQNETVCQLTLTHYSPELRSQTLKSHLSFVFIQTSPPFQILRLMYKHFENQISIDRLHIDIRCSFFFYPNVLKHINYDHLSRLITKMNYLKLNILYGGYQPAFDLIQCFRQIEYLSIKTISQAYANGHQWADLLAQLQYLSQINIHLDLDSDNIHQEYQTFQIPFWFEKNWPIQIRKRSCKYQIIHRSIQVK